ncbi:MAG TPA: Rid family hydrolase [Pseudonocardiaceae bacterium]|jgi:2-iminobutanoate/2-iminopropanoate deaminase|nr:Rid family hydrolase [Pseudonocardiaceae bacterium]
MESIVISSEGAVSPVGPHSQAVRRGNILAIGGQVGVDPYSGILCEGIHEQLRQAMTNIQELLKSADSSFADVILLHVYLTEQGHFREMNTVLSEFLTEPFPARTTVYTRLPPGMLVEVEALAVLE